MVKPDDVSYATPQTACGCTLQRVCFHLQAVRHSSGWWYMTGWFCRCGWKVKYKQCGKGLICVHSSMNDLHNTFKLHITSK